MWKSFKGLLILSLLFLGTFAQSQDNSTYSRYGVGLLSETNFIPSRAMGGLGATFRSTESVNFANPASYSALNLISFETGIASSVNKVSSEFGSGRVGSVNLSYINLAIPVKKNIWVSTMGVVPFSQKDYLLVDTVDMGSNTDLANIFEGSGTVYTAYWGNGFKYKDFSVGFNLGYIFGNTSTAIVTAPLDDEGALDGRAFASFERADLKMRGLYWNVGAQYSVPIMEKMIDKKNSKKISLDLGLAYNSNYNLGNKSKLESGAYSLYSNLLNLKDDGESWSDFLDELTLSAAEGENDGVTGADIDTFRALSTETVKVRIPSNINAGFMFVKKVKEIEHWKAGFDFKWSQWSQFSRSDLPSENILKNSWRIAAGGEIFPLGSAKKTGELKSKLFSQLKYRGGAYYSRTPVAIGSNQISEFGINFGLAIPIRLRLVNEEGFLGYRYVHAFSLGFEVGSRGSIKNDLVRDNFVRINLGISLNDKWFVKRKYN